MYAAIRRAVLEETGLIVETERLFEIFERIMHDDEGRAEYLDCWRYGGIDKGMNAGLFG